MGYTLNPFTGNFDATGSGGGGGGAVNAVTASGPLNSTGGANPNISLSGIVPIANGGTGLSAAGTVGNVLTSDGTNWVSSAPASGGANTSLSNLVTTSINQDLIPNTSGFYNLGDGGTGTAWQGLYVNAIYDSTPVIAIDIAARQLMDITSSPVVTWNGVGLDLNSKNITNMNIINGINAIISNGGGLNDLSIQASKINLFTPNSITIDSAYTSDYWGVPLPAILGNSSVIGPDLAMLVATDDQSTDVQSSDLSIQTGSLTSATATSNTGTLWLSTGSIDDSASSGTTGAMDIETGSNNGSGPSGTISIRSGLASHNPNNSGAVTFSSGNSTHGTSGQTNINTGGSTTGNSGHTVITTGNAPAGNSGAIQLITGGAGGTRGKIVLQDSSIGTAGHVWTSTDAFGSGNWAAIPVATVANGGTGLTTLTLNNVILGNGTSSPTFVAPGTSGNVLTSNGTTWVSSPATSGANTALSNLTTTSINQDLKPNVANTHTVGTFFVPFSQVIATALIVGDQPGGSGINLYEGTSSGNAIINIYNNTASQTLPSGGVTHGGIRNLDINGKFGIFTVNNGTTINIETKNNIAGNTSDISLRTGTASATRGQIQFLDGSEGTTGHVWTSTDTLGHGHWAAAGSGANTALSNLASVAVNTSLLPGVTNTIDLGSATFRFANEYISTVNIYSQIIPDLDSNRSVGSFSKRFGSLIGLQTFTDRVLLPSDGSKTQGLRNVIVGPDAVSYSLGLSTDDNQAFKLGIFTGNSSVADATATADVGILTGNKTAGTGNSGNIKLQTGTSSGGTRGDIILNSRRVTSTGPIVTPVYTVATLPSASTSGAGARAFVTDATGPAFAVLVVGGGAVSVPVYSDGTSWFVG